MSSMRGGGMQVHAVSDAERAFDSLGRQLPWGFEYADGEMSRRNQEKEEKGPFGKQTRRRGTSRSKTVTPARKEDQAVLDNNRAIDDIFGSYKASLREKKGGSKPTIGNAGTTTSAAADPAAGTSAPNAAAAATVPAAPGEPTEVILFGFGSEVQYAAIDFYERVSGGIVYEDYDRHPAHSKYNLSLTLSRAASQRGLSAAALRKRNHYVGGEHWIKVTFDSPEAADNACHYSPHLVAGFMVHAERYRGAGPKEDVAIPAAADVAGGALASSQNTSPTIRSSSTLRTGDAAAAASDTASSATATGVSYPSLRRPSQMDDDPFAPSPSQAASTVTQNTANTVAPATGAEPAPPRKQAALRIRGARRAQLLPAEQALLPVAPRWQQALGGWPLVGLLVGGGADVIGSQVPRREDGAFDAEGASFYWRLWWWFDCWLGTDFCGIKGED